MSGRRCSVLVVVLFSLLAACGSGAAPVSTAGTSSTTSSAVSSTAQSATATAPPPTEPATTEQPSVPSTTRGRPAPTATAPLTTTTVTVSSGATGIRGAVTAGPTCPVERPDQPCPPAPVDGRVDAVDASGTTAASTTTDDAGRYELRVAPGDYTVRVDTGSHFPTCPDVAVTVTAGSLATADVDCDTGIR